SAGKQLSLCWGSLDGVSFEGFLDAAAGAGFDAVTLNNAFYVQAKAAGVSDQEFAQRVRDNGLFVSDIDPLFNWLPGNVTLPGDDAISLCTQASMNDVFELAHLVGTDLVNAPLGFANPESEQQIVDGFAALCERAQQENLRVSLEFMPFNQVSNLETAARIVKQAGCSNGGIMFDCWHHHRGGGVPDDLLTVPGEHFFAFQLDDALAKPMSDVMEETLNHRELPGEGCIDLPAILKNLDTIGATPVYDVEVFNESLRSLTATQRAEKLYNSSRTFVA
ncbi:MAG: sugar phosphate isomerase/epimerase family protein, partial [Pseudomonadales bacterium]